MHDIIIAIAIVTGVAKLKELDRHDLTAGCFIRVYQSFYLSHRAYQTFRKAGYISWTGTYPSRPTLGSTTGYSEEPIAN